MESKTANAESTATASASESFGSLNSAAPTAVVNVKTLMEAGAHFGHQADRWNPRMVPFIYGERNNVHIINLDLTIKLWERARKFLVDIVSRGGSVLFVGTKQQASEIVKTEAMRCGSYFVTSRWLGGTLSNFQTIKKSIDRMKKLEELLTQAEDPASKIKLNKREKLNISRNLEKLNSNIGGIRGMKKVPDVIFIVDVIKESIAVLEGKRLRIPVVALVDTNSDPTSIDFPIPSNDDATRTISLFMAAAADAVIEGRRIFEAQRPTKDEQRENGRPTDKREGKGNRAANPVETAASAV